MDTLPSGATASGGFRSTLAVSGFRLRARLGFSIPSNSLRPARHYPRFRIRCSSSEHRRDFNPPEQCAAQRTLLVGPTPGLSSARHSGYPSRCAPVGDHSHGPGRASWVPTLTFCTSYGPRPRGSVTISPSDGAHAAFDYDNGLGLHDLQPFGAHSSYPAQPLSTLQTPRYRDARKTRFRPCPLRLWSDGTFTRAPFVSFPQRTVKCCGSRPHDQAASRGAASVD
jgi:hypothetical protein